MKKEKNNEQYGYLSLMQDQIEKLINEGRTLNESTVIYETLKNIIDLRITERELTGRFDEFSEVVIAMAQLDFSKRMEIQDTKDLFAYVSTSLNLLNEELESNVVPRTYLESALEMVPDMLVMTDSEGQIKYCNQATTQLIGFNKGELEGTRIQNLYGSEWLGNNLQHEALPVSDIEVNLMHQNKRLVPVKLSVATIPHPHQEIGGYRYYAKNNG